MNRNHDMNELKKEYMDKEMSKQQIEAMKGAMEKAIAMSKERNEKFLVCKVLAWQDWH